MITPMQEVFAQLRASKESDSFGEAYCVDWLLEMEKEILEKEREVIVRSFMNVSDDKDTRLEDVHLREFAEQYYNETFKTKENGNTKFRPRNRKT